MVLSNMDIPITLIASLIVIANSQTLSPKEQALINCNKFCSETRNTVCGNDGKEYYNSCNLQKEACIQAIEGYHLTQHNSGSCKIHPVALNDCSILTHLKCQNHNNFQYVCGSDNHSYRSKCELERRNCRHSHTHSFKAVSLKHEGACVEADHVNYTAYDPDCTMYAVDTSQVAVEGGDQDTYFCNGYHHTNLCASDHHTYHNECQFCKHMDHYNQTHGVMPEHLHILHNGTCHGTSVIG